MPASQSDIITSGTRSDAPLPHIIVTADAAETKYISLRGVIRPGLNNFTLAMQARGATVTPSFSLCTVAFHGKDFSTWSWHAFDPIAPDELQNFTPNFGFYLRAVFSAPGQLIVTSL
jgi:hypothetical protein